MTKVQMTALVFVTVDIDELRVDLEETDVQLIDTAKDALRYLVQGGFNCSTDRWVVVDDVEARTEAEARSVSA